MLEFGVISNAFSAFGLFDFSKILTTSMAKEFHVKKVLGKWLNGLDPFLKWISFLNDLLH